MSTKLWSLDINQMHLGTTEILKWYLWTVLVFEILSWWNLSWATYEKSMDPQYNDDVGWICFNSDWTKMYLSDIYDDRIEQYTLSTPYDIGSRSYIANSISNNQTADIWFKPDGYNIFTVTSTSDDIQDRDLSTAWDITTEGYNKQISRQDAVSIFFNSDWTKMYVWTFTWIYQYSLSTAWNISSASVIETYDPWYEVWGIHLKDDWTKMYLLDRATDNVKEYDLSTAWDVSTASYVLSYSVNSQATVPVWLRFSNDWTKMYIGCASTSKVYQYSTE